MMPSSTPSPSPLPITTPQSDSSTLTTTTAAGASTPASSAAFRQFTARLSDSARNFLSNRRPWSELADRSAFSRPDSISDATARLRKNLTYFRVNYLAIIAGVLALSLLTNPFSLIVLFGLFAAWSFLYLFRPSDQPLVLFGRQCSDRETLGGLVLMTVFVVFLTSVGSILMSALTVGAAIVAAHGAFRVPEDLFLDDQEGATTGFLSLFGGANTAVAGPAVVGRV